MSDKPGFPPDVEAVWSRMREAARGMKWLCVQADAPLTADQISAVRVFFPQENLLSVRRRIMEGNARVGPLLPETAEEFARSALAGTGLKWDFDAPTEAELDAMGLTPLSGP